MIRLTTLYAGNIAPAGVFDPISKKYIKACRKANAGYHPHRYALGGFDDPIVHKLKELGCQTIQLEIATGIYTVPFETFLEYGFSQRWNDPRFHFARWYCPIDRWQSDHQMTIGRHVEEAPKTAQAAEQACLFDIQELQRAAEQERRWNY